MVNIDKNLLDAHIRGDKTAFRELVLRHGDALLGYLVHITGSRDQAEDLFQETFKRVHEKGHSFAGGHFRNWILTIATNIAIDRLRRRGRIRFFSLDRTTDCDGQMDCPKVNALPVSDNNYDPSEEASRNEQKVRVRQAVLSLPAKQRLTLVLAYYQRLSYSEIAQVSGCSVGTVKTRMFRALRTLAERLPESVGAYK
jgi:RNA polymerase sigma-70 factor (ECF subfamily)